MVPFRYVAFVLMCFYCKAALAQTTQVRHFGKVIISPHIQVTFIEGDQEKVTIEQSSVSNDKINIEVNGKTLRIYLDDAKELTKNKTVYEAEQPIKRPVYTGTIVIATVTYKTLEELSVRGEEMMLCKSLLKGENFRLKLYGGSKMLFNEVSLVNLKATSYGESSLKIQSGSIARQHYVSYGESKINSLGITGNSVKITVYGESDFQVNVSDEIRITSFGNATLTYKRNPVVTKGLTIGNVEINRID